MSGRGGGGPFIHFATGTRGQAAAYVRYIARASASDPREDPRFLSRHLPPEVSRAEDLDEARELLAAFARVREDEESRGRTHFRCVMSFERPVPPRLALSMVDEWLRGSFPAARAAAFLHHDTGRLHAHVWIDARLPSGRKISLSPKENRALGERWNRIYCRELGLDERTYLDKVEETKGFRRAKARGEEREAPFRIDRPIWSREGKDPDREERDGR